MDLDEVYPDAAPFMKSQDLNNVEHTLIIRGVADVTFDEKERKITLKLERLDGVAIERLLVLNKTNARIIGGAFGVESIERAWMGRTIVLYPTVTSMGPGIGVRIPPPANAATEALGPQVERTEQLRGVANDAPF